MKQNDSAPRIKKRSQMPSHAKSYTKLRQEDIRNTSTEVKTEKSLGTLYTLALVT